MKTLFAFMLVLCAPFACGQSFNFSLTGTQCAKVAIDSQATAALQVLGSWTGTLQPSVSIAGQSPSNLPVTPASTSTPQTTITGNGAFIARVSGYSLFQVCGATITGTAKVYINVSTLAH